MVEAAPEKEEGGKGLLPKDRLVRTGRRAGAAPGAGGATARCAALGGLGLGPTAAAHEGPAGGVPGCGATTRRPSCSSRAVLRTEELSQRMGPLKDTYFAASGGYIFAAAQRPALNSLCLLPRPRC